MRRRTGIRKLPLMAKTSRHPAPDSPAVPATTCSPASLVAPATAPVVTATAPLAAGEPAAQPTVQPAVQPAVQWVDNVDFWIAQAIHAGSGDRSTGPQGKRAGKQAGKRIGKDVAGTPATSDDMDVDDSTDADLPGATLSEFDGVRYLHLGDTPWVQGAMRLRKPAAIELDYVQRMCAWLLWRTAEPDMHAVQLGLGAAALTRHAYDVLGLRTTAVELNPQVVSACRAWFHLPPDDERLQVVVSDAGAWIAAPERAASIDVLTVDLYDHQAAAPVLDDAEFYAA